jgi:hypothetical protein
MIALDTLPPEARTVSDAVMIWAGGWTPSTLSETMPLFPVRNLIETLLPNLPRECLEETLVGPRFVTVDTGTRFNTLVFGSGVWSWGQLLEPPELSPSDDGQSAIRGFLDELFAGG